MNKFEQSGEVDPKIKKEITEEGWEKTDDRDEWAVLIGKKEEMPQLLEKLETEGKTADLGTYLKLHKEISLPIQEIKDEKLKKKFLDKKGLVTFLGSKNAISDEFQLQYVDKEGNIASTKIKLSDIASYSSIGEKLQAELKKKMIGLTEIDKEKGEIKEILIKELEEYGFDHYDKQEVDENRLHNFEISEALNNYKKKLEKGAAESKKEEFDF